MKDRTKAWLRAAEPALYAPLGALLGAAVGAVIVLFGRGVDFFAAVGAEHFSLYVWFLPAVGALTAAMLRRWGGGAAGMAAAFRASRGEAHAFPLRNVFFQFAGTWGAHLFCASVGREGAGVQIGAAIGGGIGARVPLAGADKILLVAGMAAGFSALFGAPVCALFFALEVTVVGALRLRALVAAAFASFTAWAVAILCGYAPHAAEVSVSVVWSVPAAAAPARAGRGLRPRGAALLPAPPRVRLLFPHRRARSRPAGGGRRLLLAALLFWTQGRYCGLGTNLIDLALAGGAQPYDWIAKMCFTAAFLAAGFLGGEVTTFFAAGACLGCVLGGWLGLPPAIAACLGYAAVFGAATNTLAAPVLLCVELFGGDLLPYAAIVCVTAYLFNFGHSVYAQAVREGVARTAVRPARPKKKMASPARTAGLIAFFRPFIV